MRDKHRNHSRAEMDETVKKSAVISEARLFGSMTVGENVSLPCGNIRIAKVRRSRSSFGLKLDQVGLGDLRITAVGIERGMKKRAAVARALAWIGILFSMSRRRDWTRSSPGIDH